MSDTLALLIVGAMIGLIAGILIAAALAPNPACRRCGANPRIVDDEPYDDMEDYDRE